MVISFQDEDDICHRKDDWGLEDLGNGFYNRKRILWI